MSARISDLNRTTAAKRPPLSFLALPFGAAIRDRLDLCEANAEIAAEIM